MKRELIKEKLINFIDDRDFEVTEESDFVNDFKFGKAGFIGLTMLLDKEFGDTDLGFNWHLKYRTIGMMIDRLFERLVTEDEYIPKFKPGDRAEVFGDDDDEPIGIGILIEFMSCWPIYPEINRIEHWEMRLEGSEAVVDHWVRVSDKIKEN